MRLPIFEELAFGREDLFMGDDETTRTIDRPRICTVCHNPEDNHPYRHAFTAAGSPVDVSQFRPERPGATTGAITPGAPVAALTDALSVPFDPVLRLALIDAGVITPEQLAEAQRKMQAMNADVLGK